MPCLLFLLLRINICKNFKIILASFGLLAL
nr:MAG TPA: hypothetical protein [Caudoviricetes sp.]